MIGTEEGNQNVAVRRRHVSNIQTRFKKKKKNIQCTNTQDLHIFIDGNTKMISHRKRARKRQENNKTEN